LYELVVPPESPCGCGSGKRFGDCHLQDGKVVVAPRNVWPKPPKTGESIRKCLFSAFNDCGGGISGDHILSASVLRAISEQKITLQSPLFSRSTSINSDSLKTKRLCRRHNSAFGPLDEEARRLFRAFNSIDASLASGSNVGPRLFLFSGFDVERWLLKTLYMAWYAKLTGLDPKTTKLSEGALRHFFEPLKPPLGLYVPIRDESEDKLKLNLSRDAAVQVFSKGNQVAGIAVTLSGVELLLVLDHDAIYLERYVFRPEYINFFEDSHVISLAFLWEEHAGKMVWISRGKKDTQIPINI
jgi:hypothetical protein